MQNLDFVFLIPAKSYLPTLPVAIYFALQATSLQKNASSNPTTQSPILRNQRSNLHIIGHSLVQEENDL